MNTSNKDNKNLIKKIDPSPNPALSQHVKMK
jgi:hypothetical protein